ncbi:unnamed protein product [Coffea canephora]|uniref:Uncharacterized protein n=1 Tax=Coffea canephora TaxID=49390 RepID=A0A068TNF8_COFCA|nr:unnamed protein product [Coffea canephora]
MAWNEEVSMDCFLILRVLVYPACKCPEASTILQSLGGVKDFFKSTGSPFLAAPWPIMRVHLMDMNFFPPNFGCDILKAKWIRSYASPTDYRMHAVTGNSAITEVIQAYVAAFHTRKLELPEDSSTLYKMSLDNEAAIQAEFLPHNADFKFLDKAAIQKFTTESEKPNPWKLCRVTHVENAKILLKMLPIFC